MKKLIFILFLFVGFAGYSQSQNFIIESARLDGFIYNTKSGGLDTLATLNPDSLGQFLIKNISDPEFPLDAVNFRTLLEYGSGGLDSMTFSTSTGTLNIYAGASVLASANLDDRYVLLTDSTTLWVTNKQLQDSIDALNTKINTELETTVYSITLPSSTTIAGRITGAIDVPTGWTLSEGANSSNLDINHGLGRRVANVSVFYLVTGTEYRQLVNFNSAYSGILTPSTNELRIEGLTTIQKTIQIFITFE